MTPEISGSFDATIYVEVEEAVYDREEERIAWRGSSPLGFEVQGVIPREVDKDSIMTHTGMEMLAELLLGTQMEVRRG